MSSTFAVQVKDQGLAFGGVGTTGIYTEPCPIGGSGGISSVL